MINRHYLHLSGSAAALLLSVSFLSGQLSWSLLQQQHQGQHNASSTATGAHQLSSILTGQTDKSSSIVSGGSVAVEQSDGLADLSSAMLKTYIRTNSMRAYHLDLHTYRLEAKFEGDPSHVDSQSAEHQQRCARHLNVYKEALRSFNELDPMQDRQPLDALRLADTFGRPESSLLVGNQFWLGNYDGCVGLEVSSPAGERIKSQYCLAVSQFPNWNPQDSKTSVKIGLCLPETCTSSMLNDIPELSKTVDTMMEYQLSVNQPFRRLKIREVYCLPHESSQVRQLSLSAILLLGLIGLFVGACLLATAIDHLNTRALESSESPAGEEVRNWRTILVESFSLTRNIDKFFHLSDIPSSSIGQQSPTDEPKFDRTIFLSSITGLKCLGLVWIIFAHTFLVGPISSRNLIDIDKLTKTYLANVYLTAHLMVDTFFALSGLLASFFLFRDGLDKITTTNWVVLAVHRYWRLTPIYLLSYWFTKSLGHLANSGPLWDYMTAEQSPRLNCARESWFTALLHLSDFKSPKDHCVPFAWFIANGIKFWLVTPFFLIAIHKSMRRGYQLTVGAILANMALVAVLAASSNVNMRSVLEFRPESADDMLNNMGEVYSRPYSRVGAYLVGLLAGHLMYMLDTKQMEVTLSNNSKRIIWSLVSVTVIAMTFIIKLAGGFELDERAVAFVFSISSALIRPLWAVCTCWLVFALSMGQCQPLARFLSSTCWRLIVKLSFCAYLAQGEVIAQLVLAVPSSAPYTYVEMVSRPIVITVITLFVSLIMVLVLEYPLTGIEEFLLPRKSSKSSASAKLAVGTNGTPNANVNKRHEKTKLA